MYRHRQRHTDTGSRMVHRGRANCICSRQGPIASSLCSFSATVSLVPVLSFSRSLPLSLPPKLIYPFPFLAQPVSFYPLFTGYMQSSSSSSPPSVCSQYSTQISLLHTTLIGKVWLLSALSIVAIARLSLSSLPFYLFVAPISPAVLLLTSLSVRQEE